MQTSIAQPGHTPPPHPGTPLELPTLASWKRMQANPRLPQRNATLLAEFEAAPWLLPPRTPAFPYAGVHALDKLLRIRATPMGRYNKTIAMLAFDRKFALLTQNTIYSMVKHGGVRNYLVGTWSAADLEACAAMNLPCADLAPWLPVPMNNQPGAGGYMTHDYLVIGWLRAVVMAHLLRQGFVVYLTDSDIGFANKPVWQSYLAFVEEVGADAAFQAEEPIVNIGNYIVLPTPAAIRFFEVWAGSATSAIRWRQQDQTYLNKWKMRRHYTLCGSRTSCLAKREKASTRSKALFRTYRPSYWMFSDSSCDYFAKLDNPPLIDSCDFSVLFLHPICIKTPERKVAIMKQQGFWFIDEASCFSNTTWAACRPLRWRQPGVEDHLYSCSEYNLAFVHERPDRQVRPRL